MRREKNREEKKEDKEVKEDKKRKPARHTSYRRIFSYRKLPPPALRGFWLYWVQSVNGKRDMLCHNPTSGVITATHCQCSRRFRCLSILGCKWALHADAISDANAGPVPKMSQPQSPRQMQRMQPMQQMPETMARAAMAGCPEVLPQTAAQEQQGWDGREVFRSTPLAPPGSNICAQYTPRNQICFW